MEKTFLSIVTISYNQAKYLKKAIESVIDNRADDIEYIVVDAGSTDGSREIISEYANDIDHIIFETDQGPSDGLNKGFAKARGTIGFFLNSDDYFLPGAIEKLRNAWSTNMDKDFMLCRAWMVNGSGEPLRELIPTPITISHLRLGAATIVQQGFSFKMDVFRLIGGFNLENRSCWDYELLCELAGREATFGVSNERIAAFRVYDESITGGGAGEKHEKLADKDFVRIHRSCLSDDRSFDRMKMLKVGRWYKMLFNPSHALHRVREHLFPTSILTRWEKDTDFLANHSDVK
ncbi:glycosyltransferase [Parasphingorhabdus sp.]|uniref:glycosyltransferase n=1 Tax=Parasphingorhabdus sp. TaxID=2709688 RepID=UPI003001607E